MLSAFQGFTLAYHLVAMVTCSALAMLVTSQVRQDTTSRLFILLMATVTIIAFLGTLARMVNTLDFDNPWVFLLFTISSCFTAFLPGLVFIFYTEFLQIWTTWRRISAFVLILCAVLADIALASGYGYLYFQMSAEGYVTYKISQFVYLLLVVGEAGILITLQSAFVQYRSRQNKETRRLLVGIIIMCIGYLLIAVPAANKWVPQIAFFSLSGVVIVGPILRQRLFDPLTQLNIKLTHQAEQLSIITRVGHQANSLLELGVLLNVIVSEIQQAFDYYAVTIYIFDYENKALKTMATAGAAAEDFLKLNTRVEVDSNTLIGATAVMRQIVNVGKVHEDGRYSAHELRLHTQSEVDLPLIVGSTSNLAGETLIGVLDIQSNQPNSFSTEDLEVLQILAQQTAISIRNVQLFEETQVARLAADAANKKKTQFLSEMSHELRTPLQTVITNSQWMLSHPEMYGNVPLPKEYLDDMLNIVKSGKHLHNLINDVLDLNKIEAGEYEVVRSNIDPILLLHDVESTYTGLLREGVAFQRQYSNDLPRIYGDDLNIKKILGNLVGNACKFTLTGSITLKVSVGPSEVCFSIADTGPGISPEAQTRLFLAYSQGDRKTARDHEGTGLGLFLCKQLVTLHKGRIWCESMEGQGSTFYFTIPLAVTENEPAAKAVANHNSSRAVVFPKSERKVLPTQILVLDVEANTRNQLSSILSDAQYEVVMTTTAADAGAYATASLPAGIVLAIHPDSSSEILEVSNLLRKNVDLQDTKFVDFKIAADGSILESELLEILARELSSSQSVLEAK